VRSTVSSYRNAIGVFAYWSNLEVWFASMRAEDLEGFTVNDKGRQRLQRTVSKARANDLNRAVAKFTEVVDGRRQFRDDPPLLHRVETFYSAADPDQIGEALHRFLVDYLLTLPDDVQLLMSRYRVFDEALKVVGVGSVGTRCYILLGEGRDAEDLMLLQVKEADTSVLAPWWESSAFSNEGERVVQGQRIMQAASDPFLGWAQMGSQYYYLRQFRVMKGSVDLSEIPRGGASRYLSLCGWTLARAHARSGHAVAISAHLGTTDKFDEALVTFARRYADQVELDYRAFAAAASSGGLAVAADPVGS